MWFCTITLKKEKGPEGIWLHWAGGKYGYTGQRQEDCHEVEAIFRCACVLPQFGLQLVLE